MLERPPAMPSGTPKTRVVLAEDVTLLRELIERILRTAPGIELIGSAASVDALLPIVQRRGCPDVALVDLWMPDGVPSGFDAPARLRRVCPEVRLLALSASLRDADVRRAFDSGFDGYSTKQVTPELLAERVRSVASGRRYLDPEVSGALASGGGEALETIELSVLQAIALGKSQSEVATGVRRGERQVRRILARACEKLGAKTPAQAVALAVARGLIRA